MAAAAGRQGNVAMKSHYACIPLSNECKDDLKVLQKALLSDARELNLRTSGIDGAHFTLSVFRIDKNSRKDGETEEQLIKSINEVLQDFLQKWTPLELTFGDIGSFGSRMVFINLANGKQLETLRKDMNNLLKEEGLHITDDRFTPHITLFRTGYRGDGREPKLTVQDMVRRTDLLPVTSTPVSEILFKKLRD